MILKGVPSTIRALITDAEGEPAAKEIKVTVKVVKDSTGATVVAAGEAETDANGVATYELAAQSELDRFTVTWTVAEEGGTFTTIEEMVGLRLCSLPDVATSVNETLTTEKKATARDYAEQFLEDECGVAFRPTYAHECLDADGGQKLYLPHPKVSSIRSVVIGETEATQVTLTEEELGELKVYPEEGYVWRASGWAEGHRNIEVIYEHGFDNPPGQARRVAGILARHLATQRLSNLDERSTSYTTDEATYSLIVAGIRGNQTSLPEVNAFIEAWQFSEVS